jgi:hypothetical protein
MSATETDARKPVPSKDAANRIVDATTCATHLAHEAQLAKSMIQDTVEDKIYAARRALKLARRRVEQLDDYKHEVVRHVKRRPLMSTGLALASGLMIGVACGWIIGHRRRGESPERLIENR